MSNIDKRALREAAEMATPGRWEYYPGNTSIEYNVDSMDEDQGSIVYVDSGDFTQKQTDLNGAFIAAANPTTVLALLDELEAKDNRINRLEAIVAVAEQRNALMREWKRALKVPCDLVDDQVPVVIHGMTIRLERLKEAEAKLEAKDRCIAEQACVIAKQEKWIMDIEATMIAATDRAEAAEKRIAEQSEIMRQAASDISYAIFNLTGSDLSRLNPGVVETTDPTDTALIAERNLRAAAAGKGEAS
ncbi:TPA: ead/Ea22-like family protein [Enterobacter hormaechei]|uniref:ead/Ea22-like family protein n=1 Tax=Enterobacter hormaechei TaxID=158836 RepID=UPI000DCB01D0|nr:ead/Ea22-like family protein [Enterobacter hormaechei]EKK5425461.1 ead/Ea22-like family protein [Enterobacter hormaechei]MCM7610460.1 ead/Ea22-like family protein [Enterobacter hormaechei]MCR8830300.1 ead/Ea22-like family protein [Enterobacter hormaechei]MCR8835496.1 ead/Ea22-like family protein [Enterobacter hormaechei]MCR8840223.1 ead/Ea22-like family protein [Enterobacter hormaechei]